MLTLKRACAVICALGLHLVAPTASAQQQAPEDVERSIRTPNRLTAGASNEFMGSLSPSEDRLYFVSDSGATLDLVVQNPVESEPQPASDGFGDVAWPETSPDGKRISYVSFERDATGDACVRNIRSKKETCVTDSKTAELQVLWWDNESLAVLSRNALHGDFSLSRIDVESGSRSKLVTANMVGITLSPDRKWLAYIPLERRRAGVGVTFSNRASKSVMLRSLPNTSGASITYKPPLPGVTGFLAFSADGNYLYFAQYLNDTNQSGAIDGDDNGVIFRVPFRSNEAAPLRNQIPEQLTSALWDCHYPSPSKTQLVVTCSRDGSLDIYSLALDGAVPRMWDSDRVRAEIDAARDRWEQLLLYSRLLSLQSQQTQRIEILRRMMSIHIELREYESALYYAKLLGETGKKTSEWARLMTELALHRQSDVALIRGQPSRQYLASETERAKTLALLRPNLAGDLRVLAGLVVSEIEDDIGDKEAAGASFSELDIAAIKDPLIIPLVAERARRLMSLRGDREGMLKVYSALAAHSALSTVEKLRYAHEHVRELVRGRSRQTRRAELAKWSEQVPEESELALLLEVEGILLNLSDENQEEVREKLFLLFRKTRDPDRRRTMVLSVINIAAQKGNEYLQYQFVNSWASALPYLDPQRKHAEVLYRNVVLDRAYGEGAQGDVGESRGYFYGTTVGAQSLEGHTGFIEARFAEGKDDVTEVYAKRFAKDLESPVLAFVNAYLIARLLPSLEDAKRHQAQVKTALEHIRVADKGLPQRAEIHQLWGFLLHQSSRRQGSRNAAVLANRHYLLGLDLAKNNPRISAALLQQVGILQASLGNHRTALDYFRRRDLLPHVRPLAELGFCVAMARSAWHAKSYKTANRKMLRGRELIKEHKSLAKYRPLVLDRHGLIRISANDFEPAQTDYTALNATLDSEEPDNLMPLNQVKAKLGLAISSLANSDSTAAMQALLEAEKLTSKKAKLDTQPTIVWEQSLLHDYQLSTEGYQAIIAGLLAQAHRLSGNFSEAEKAMVRRERLLVAKLAKVSTDKGVLELARTHHHLAELSYRQGNLTAARKRIESGLEYSATYNKRTGSGVNEAGLRLVQAYAELHIYGGVSLSEYQLDLVGELKRAYGFMSKYQSPQWKDELFLFEFYLTMLVLPS